MNNSLPIMFILHKSLPIDLSQTNLTENFLPNETTVKATVLCESLPNETTCFKSSLYQLIYISCLYTYIRKTTG